MTNRTLNDVQINIGFNEANTRKNIASGESLNTIFGKTKKWFSDLKAVAFTGNYSDLNNAPNIPEVDYYTISIATSNWTTNSSGGYSCTKTVTGLLTTDNIISDVVLSTDRSAAMLQLVAWECLIDGCITVTAANTVKFWCYNTKPTVALTVGLQVIR